MKIAVLYTGELRTYESTVKLFKKNLLLNDNYHVFAVIQSDEQNNYKNVLEDNIGDNLKKLINLNKNDDTWIILREELLGKLNIDDSWKNYLRNSGSMIEYYQMHLAYKLMDSYETENNIKYDYVIRFRTDTVLKDSICFDWMNYTDDKIRDILYKIKNKFNFNNIISNEVLNIFMNVFYNEKRIYYSNNYPDNIITSKIFDILLMNEDENKFINDLNNYIKSEKFIISFRVNVIYFMKRELMENINLLGINYGKYIYEKDAYWFNSECQLKQICVKNDIDFFSSTTEIEDKSLYEYNKSNYFDENDNLIDNNFSFLIKRI